MDAREGIALRKVIHFRCDGHKSLNCTYDFDGHDLRYGRETVGRGAGYFCKKCFQEHCAGRSWDDAPTLCQVIIDSNALAIYQLTLNPEANPQ